MNKRGIEIGFNLIFAILAGSVILFLAIYGASKFIGNQENTLNTESAAQIASILDPLETGLASGKASQIDFVKESQTDYECDEFNNEPFGTESVSFKEKGNINAAQKVSVKDKYIFADSPVIRKSYFIFSMPFFMAYKVADINVIGSRDYCFYSASDDVIKDVSNLNLKNIAFLNSSQVCRGISVCFNEKPNCDIKVSLANNYVQKNGKRLYYENSLMYAAIFSSPDVYECNVKRLKNKFDELGSVYVGKLGILEKNGCSTNIADKLNSIKGNINSSRELITLEPTLNEIDQINSASQSGCQVY